MSKIEANLTTSSICDHPGIFNSMCVSCGKIILQYKENNKSLTQSLTILSNGNQIHLSNHEAQSIQQSKTNVLKLSKKIALVLDLDHTLIHSCERKSGPTEEEVNLGINLLSIEESPAIGLRHYLVKFRPYLKEFLEEMNKICQLSIYTAGTRKYAEGVAKLMDPTGKLFLGRIVSRSDNINGFIEDKPITSEKSLSRIFLNDASLAVILDDREDVWRGEQSEQLLLVKPYKYFNDVLEVNNASGPTNILSKTSPNNQPNQQPLITLSGPSPGKPVSSHTVDFDDQLLRCIDIIKSIHSYMYENSESTSETKVHSAVSAIKSLKRQVLKGCIIAFVGIPWAGKNLLMNLATSLGGRVTDDLHDNVTHIICVNINTLLTDLKNKSNIWILHPDWLLYSRWALSKVLETTFSLIPLDFNNLPNPTLHIDVNHDRTSKRIRSDSYDQKNNLCSDSTDGSINTAIDRIVIRIPKSKLANVTQKNNHINNSNNFIDESKINNNTINDSDSDDDWNDFDDAIKTKLNS